MRRPASNEAPPVVRIASDAQGHSAGSPLRRLLRPLVFLFDRPALTPLSAAQSYRLPVIFILLEVIVRPLIKAEGRGLKIAASPWWQPLQLAILIAATCWLIRKWIKADYTQLGLARWQGWSKAERLYLAQIVPITIGVFSFLTSAQFRALWTRPHFWQAGSTVLLTQMIWGAYQELMYRGVLQTGLVNRLGTTSGILASNLVFTFGPLHAYHFSIAQAHHQHLWIFAGIFTTGLLFAILFKNSANLWIVMGLHGLGDFFIDGLVQLARLLR